MLTLVPELLISSPILFTELYMVTRTESQHASLSLWFCWERALVQEIRWEGRRKWSLAWPVCCSTVGNSVCCPSCHAYFLSPRAAGGCCLSLVSLQGEFFVFLAPTATLALCLWENGHFILYLSRAEGCVYPKYVLQKAISWLWSTLLYQPNIPVVIGALPSSLRDGCWHYTRRKARLHTFPICNIR